MFGRAGAGLDEAAREAEPEMGSAAVLGVAESHSKHTSAALRQGAAGTVVAGGDLETFLHPGTCCGAAPRAHLPASSSRPCAYSAYGSGNLQQRFLGRQRSWCDVNVSASVGAEWQEEVKGRRRKIVEAWETDVRGKGGLRPFLTFSCSASLVAARWTHWWLLMVAECRSNWH
jgi:hypothetical protein